MCAVLLQLFSLTQLYTFTPTHTHMHTHTHSGVMEATVPGVWGAIVNFERVGKRNAGNGPAGGWVCCVCVGGGLPVQVCVHMCVLVCVYVWKC
jgi:hypothetical protein